MGLRSVGEGREGDEEVKVGGELWPKEEGERGGEAGTVLAARRVSAGRGSFAFRGPSACEHTRRRGRDVEMRRCFAEVARTPFPVPSPCALRWRTCPRSRSRARATTRARSWAACATSWAWSTRDCSSASPRSPRRRRSSSASARPVACPRAPPTWTCGRPSVW